MKESSYYWERRKVIKRAAKNLLKWFFREPFRRRGRPGDTVILFVCQNARNRIYSMGHPLRKNEGVRTILFSQVFEYPYQSKAFDEIHFYLGYRDLQRKVIRMASRYNVLAVVGSTEPIHQSRVLIDMKRRWPVLINQFDSYWSSTYFAGIDVHTDKTYHYIAPEVEEEEYCFRSADGIIARTGELPLLFKEQQIMTPVFLYEDGCDPAFFQPIRLRTTPKGEEWSVVYAGIFYPMNLDPRVYGSAQMVPLGRELAREKIHLHLYPSPIHDYQYPEYYAEMTRNPYFHIHPSVDYSRVQKEISRYDFGWYANRYLQYGFTSEVYRRFAVASKICTYLEAGLPVISNGLHLRSAELVRETGCGILVGEDAARGLGETIRRQDLTGLLRGVMRAREGMDFNRKSGELMAFIKGVQNRAHIQPPSHEGAALLTLTPPTSPPSRGE